MADLAKGVLSIDTHEEAAAVSGLLSTLMELLPRKEFDEWTRSTKVSISKDTYFVALKSKQAAADDQCHHPLCGRNPESWVNIQITVFSTLTFNPRATV